MSGSAAAFPAFFDRHYAELSRLAYLLTGDASSADDLAADALSRVRRDWRGGGDDPAARARGLVAALTRHRERWSRFGPGHRPGAGTAPDLRAALRRLPHRRRVCVVLRYAYGLSEGEVARTLGITAGAVRSRTARGVRQLSALLGGAPAVTHRGGWEAAR
ncbi:sigma factor-like helix-turn-helix DNA-binding protein [Actinoplanes sp. NPDC049599]|uniref:sigma factor-like helix-turn-helix DNA-binding protein n=1 Tax=Actinoplanes sp. NPDC049599 TaxID=3363903 RepID=UPI0037AF27E5